MSTDTPAESTIQRDFGPGMRVVSMASSGVTEFFITADLRDRDIAQVGRDVMSIIAEKGAAIVTQVVFAPMGPANEFRLEGRVVGSVYQDDSTKFCCLGDLWTSEADASRTEQAAQTFDMIERAMELSGMDFSNVVRTWLYLDELLEWYDPFNHVRDDFFRRRGVFDALVPSSTGISGANPAGAAMIAAAMGIQSLDGSDQAEMLPSPLQCPALEYGSSFSRAVAIDQRGRTRVTVSGTASIEPGGDTVFLDDVPGQIDLTMKVVAAILAQRDMDFSDATRAIAYFKRAEYARDYEKYCADNGIPDMPTIITENDVCRHDLLFEIELDTVSVTG